MPLRDLDNFAAHVGGIVATRSSTVMIGGLPAARQGDSVIEAVASKRNRNGDSRRPYRMIFARWYSSTSGAIPETGTGSYLKAS